MFGSRVTYAFVCVLWSLLVAGEARANPGSNHRPGSQYANHNLSARVLRAQRQLAWPPRRLIGQRTVADPREVVQAGHFGDAFMVDTSIVLGPASGSSYSYGAASNGDGWRVLWASDNDYSVRSTGIGSDGSLLDPQGITVGHYDYMSSMQFSCLVGTDEGFMAVWPAGDYRIRGATLDSSGALLDSFVVFESDSGQALPAIAFDGDSTCLVVWNESPYGDGDILGARVTTSGQVLDLTPISVAADSLAYEQMPSVAFGQGVYMVAWTASTDMGDFARAVRVSREGMVLDTTIFLRHDPATYQSYATVAFGDTCFLAAWAEGMEQPDMFAARVSASGTLIDTAGIQLSSSPDYDMLASIGFDGTNYLVMWHDIDTSSYSITLCGRRVTADGAPLDSAMIRPQIAGLVCLYPSVVADQANFLLAFTATDTMTFNCIGCMRISPEGAVLDSGILFPMAADAQSGPSGTSDGTDFLAAWLETRSQGQVISAARLSANGQVLDPAGFLVNGAPGQKSSLSTAFGDSVYLVAWDAYGGDGFPRDIYCARVNLDGSVMDTAGILVCRESLYRYQPDISFDGQNFLVVWTDSRSQVTNNIYAARVSPGGVVLDPNGFVVAAADTFDDAQPAVCFTGTHYLVVWPGMNTNIYESRVHGALVSPAGRIAKPRFVIGGADNFQSSPSVARGPTNLLVAWEDARSYPTAIYAARVRADGTVLDPNGVRVDTADGDHSPRVTADEAGFQVIWSRLDYYSDTTTFTVAQIDAAGRIIRKGDWYRLPGSDNGFDAVYGSGPELLLLFSCWTDTVQGRDYGNYRLWGRFDAVTGIADTMNAERGTRTLGPTIIRGILFLPSSVDKRMANGVLLDITGRKVLDIHPGANDVSALAPGVYFVRSTNGTRRSSEVTKVILTE